jgi:hypothetical protein
MYKYPQEVLAGIWGIVTMGESTAARSIGELADLATPMSIRVAATLDLAERAGGAGATVERLAQETGTDAAALRLLLDHLVAVGVFEVESGRYRATELGAQLREDAPGGIKPLLDINRAGGRSERAFVEVLATITTGESAYTRRYGREFWADLGATPRLRTSFDAQMNWRFQTQAPQIARRFDWGRFPEILDVGGGDGTLLVEILRAHPTVRGRVLDLGPTAAAATERFGTAGLGDRAGVVAQSFFEALPGGADVYVLSDILHDWDDEQAGAILARCREALGRKARVVVVEPLRDGTNTAINLHMLMCFGGRERSVEELAELAAGTGLALLGSSPVSDGRTALEFGVAD